MKNPFNFFKRNNKINNEKKNDLVNEKNKYVEINFPIGEKFIIISNDYIVNPNTKYDILEVTGYDYITLAKNKIPVFKNIETNEKDLFSFGFKIRYTPEIYEIIKKLTPEESFNLFMNYIKE